MKKRILYGLASEGMGHAIRSKVVLSRLAGEYELMIVCAGRAYKTISAQFDNTHEIVGTTMAYRNNALDFLGTVGENLKNAPKAIARNAKALWTAFTKFKPDLVITDFESLVSLYADLTHVPMISIDNMQAIDKCEIEFPERLQPVFLVTKKIVHDRVPRAAHYIITTFFDAPVRDKYRDKVSLVPPILRDEILKAEVSRGDHVLVYQTSQSAVGLPDILKAAGGNFLVYGFNRDEDDGRVIYRSFDETRFVRDLASCRAVYINGGYTTMGEALYLGKPILSAPIGNHFEQILNGIYVEKMGFGKLLEENSLEGLKEFLGNIDKYSAVLGKLTQDGNSALYEALEKKISELLTVNNEQ